MDKRYYLLIGIVAAFVIGMVSYTITGMTATGENLDCDVEPYDVGVVTAGEKTVCVAGDLVDVYDKDGWVFIGEYNAPYTVSADGVAKGYECYACPQSKVSDVILWIILGVLVTAVIGYFVVKRKSRA